MNDARENFYITTAIDYPNGVPHIGHAYEKVLADFYARCARLRGHETWLLVGLDEHGLKIQQAADREGKEPQAFVDEKAAAFQDLYRLLDVSNDDFIRTSEPRHHEYARRLYDTVREKGDVYKGDYETDYCVSCEQALQKSDITAGKCLVDEKRPLTECPVKMLKESSYFFRLGNYREAVRDHIQKNPDFIVPARRRNEVLARLDDEVRDLSISRSSFHWGVPLTDDPEHVLYVWFDALSNYVSALEQPVAERRRFWPADCHVIGKDILWFHTVIWPAMLLSAGLPLPRQVYVHGFILDKSGRKMAKSLGNVVDPVELVREFGVDVLRYYFLRAFSSGEDGRFGVEDLEDRYQNELGNDFGNLILRLSKLGLSRAGGVLSPGEPAADLGGREVAEAYFRDVDAREHHKALDTLWAFLRRINAFLNETAPWKIEDDAEVGRILYAGVDAMAWALHLLAPVMPTVAASAAKTLGVELGPMAALESQKRTYRVEPGKALFPRRDRPEKKPSGGASPKGGGAAPKKKGASGPVDPFAKLELRVGQIVEVEEHPDAEKLFALQVDLGGDRRSICAGLREHLSAQDLEQRKVVVVANLKPAMLRGVESRGMILASDRSDGKVVPVDPGEAALGDLVVCEGIESRPKTKISRSDFEKAPLTVVGGRVVYAGKPLRTSVGDIVCDAGDGAPVR